MANFTANTISGCSPIVVTYTYTGTGGAPVTYLWDLGNGTTSGLASPATSYIAAGTYTVSLTVTNASGTSTKTISNYINVIASPTVNFIANDSLPGCAPKTIQFTDLSLLNSVGAGTYYWDFGDGNHSSLQSPSHVYTNAGSYTVTLLVTNSVGCSKTLTKTSYIQVSKPTADFTAVNVASCTLPLTTNFTNASSNGAVSYQWNFGDGYTSTATSPSHTYTVQGAYNVTLIATNAAGCKDTIVKQNFINIGGLAAIFSLSPAIACASTAINFTNASTPAAAISTWYFGDGTTSTATNPSHTYAAGGTYTVKLDVTNNGCVDSTTHTVTIYPAVAAGFTANPTVGCSLPFATTFTNTSTGAISYAWDFGDGYTSTAASPTHSYTAYGSYTVRLIATNSNGCVDTLVRPAYINVSGIGASIVAYATTGCVPVTYTFVQSVYSAVPIASYTWNFGDGTTGTGGTVVHTYTIAGSYAVTLSYTTTTGCTGSVTTSFPAYGPPNASFTASPLTVCAGSPVAFTNTSTNSYITTYQWNFGDGAYSSTISPNHIYGSQGTYTVTLIAINGGCLDTFVRPNYITVNPPLAMFNPTYSCGSRKQYTFINQSSGATSYAWDFGDGFTSTTSGNPVHTYTTNGTYTVTLTAYNSTYGCTNIYTKVINIFDLTAAYTANTTAICKGDSVTFTATANANYASYNWDFGDGTIALNSTPVKGHVFSAAGTYNVKLVVKDASGCADSLIRPGYITVGGPTVAFTGTPLSGCKPLVVSFTDGSVQGGTTAIVSRQWTFGDGTTLNAIGTSVLHTYNAGGTYTVKLLEVDASGCKDSLVRTNYITVSQPYASFTVSDTNVCGNQAVAFTNNSSGGTSVNWLFGDGFTSTTSSPSHAYTNTGIYTAKLIINAANGCADTASKNIHVTAVHANFSMSDSVAHCPPLTVTFTNTSTSATTYLWDFGNGSTSTQTSPTAVFVTPGTFTIKLKAFSAGGCVDSMTRTVLVSPAPSGTFTYTPISGCMPLTVNFTATVSNATSFTWDLNNGVTVIGTGSTLTYAYTTGGAFVPKLIISSGPGCITSIIGTDTIKVSRISSGFTANPNPACVGTGVQFTDTSSTTNPVSNPINSRAWVFGDGNTSTAANPLHPYTTAGTYTVRLIVTALNGCLDTVYHTVTINPLPVITTASQSICAGDSVQLLAAGGASYSWSPATGLSCTACANPYAHPTATITYTVTGTGTNGCINTAQAIVTVKPRPVVTVSPNQSVCSGSSVSLTAAGATTYAWSPATGLSATTGATVSASPTATSTYTVTGTGTNNCPNTAQVTVTVNPVPVATVSANQFICPGGSAALTAGGGTSYAWSPATGLSATTGATVTASPTATTTYTVTVGNGTCTATQQVTVTVNNQPTIAVSGTTAVCAGGSTTLTAGGANTYSWSPAAGLSATTGATVTASPASTTTYTVTGTSGIGCTGTTTVTVTVNPLPTVSAGPNVSICAGASTTLNASGASTYAWSPTAGLSCNTCASPTASPTATTTYLVSGTNSTTGCSNTASVIVTVNPLPVVSAGSNTSICPGGSAQLQATGAVSYVWSPATGLSATNIANPVASPASTTTYMVTGTSATGCTATSTVTVSVNAQPVITVAGTTTICAGGSTTLTASGANSFTWSPAATLSAANTATVTATPSTTTTYTVTGTSGVGCTATTTVTVTVNPLPTVSAGTNAAVCAGACTTLHATGATTYVWSPAATLSASTSANPVACPTATTTYTVTGANANGCSNTSSVIVTVNPLPVVSAGSNTSICPGGNAQLQATGATSYVWFPATGLSSTTIANPVASPSVTTTYTVTGTNAAGCTATSTVTVSVNAQPTITVSGITAICAGGSTTLTAAGANAFTWSPATGLSSTTTATVTANPTATTTYTVTGTSGVGCTGTTTVTVTVNPLPTVSAGPNVSICAGASTTLNASGASTYAWTPAGSLSAATGATVTASPAATTTYTLTGTNSATGCSNTASVIVTVNPLPVVSAGSNTSICPGGSAQLQATGAVSYVWSPATGLSATNIANPVASPASTTTYTVTGTNSFGCTATSTVTVSVNAQPTIVVLGTTSICQGTSTTLIATGANSFTWSPGTGLSSTTSATVIANPAITTTYTVTGTSGVGCTASTTVTVTVHATPNVSATASTYSICPGSSTTLTATGGSSYVWTPTTGLGTPNAATTTASPATTTTYIVTGTDAFGCTDTGIVTVNLYTPPVVTASVSSAFVCRGTSVQLQAGGASTYVWSPATALSATTGATVTATPITTTTYTVTGTDIHGCTATAQATAGIYQPPVVSAGGPVSICQNASVTLTATGAASYLWTPGGSLSATTSASVVASPAVTTTYSVTGTDIHGCTGSAQVTVTVHALPVISGGANQTACLNTPVQLQASGAATYAWSPAAGLSNANISNPIATPTATTTYTVTGTDAFGCSGTAQVTVTINPLPVVTVNGGQSICGGDSVQLQASGAVSYAWSPAAGLSCTTCANPKASPASPTTYTVTGTGANGCTKTATVAVSIYPQPKVNAGPDQTICVGQSAQLVASGADTYLWSPASYLSCTACAATTSTPPATISYEVAGIDVHGCKDSDNVTVTVIPKVPTSVGPGGEICEDGTFQLSATGGTAYAWTPASTLSSSTSATPIAHPNGTTTYHVVITENQCFSDTYDVTVTVHPKPTVSAGADQTIVGGGSAQLHATGNNIAAYAWTPSDSLSCATCADPVATPPKTTKYTVNVTSDFGCAASDDVTIFVKCDGSQIWLPNTFMPGALENNFFYPHGKGVGNISRFRIYDRWGELIYDIQNFPANDKSYGWDGTYKNQPLKPDVFVYVLNGNCSNGEQIEVKGDITLIR